MQILCKFPNSYDVHLGDKAKESRKPHFSKSPVTYQSHRAWINIALHRQTDRGTEASTGFEIVSTTWFYDTQTNKPGGQSGAIFFFFGGGAHNCRLIAQETGRSSFGDAPRSEQQQHGRDGTDFPFKISSRDLTGCHYCAALSDGSADERAIAVGNRHEKVDQMEARDTQALEGRRQRGEGGMRRSRTRREIIQICSCAH